MNSGKLSNELWLRRLSSKERFSKEIKISIKNPTILECVLACINLGLHYWFMGLSVLKGENGLISIEVLCGYRQLLKSLAKNL